jgi:hypothetical protein
MVFTGWPHTGPGLAEVECVASTTTTDLSQYATLDFTLKNSKSQSPLKIMST